MHVEPEQRRRAPRIRRPATGRFVRRSKLPGHAHGAAEETTAEVAPPTGLGRFFALVLCALFAADPLSFA
jgi:hypothetical protein